MPDNPQILKTAQHMVERYGEEACQQVDMRIEEFTQSEGDYSEALEFWGQVRQIVIKLTDN